jgi:acyl carrier protein
MRMRDQLLALIDSWDVQISEDLHDDTPLITSGMFDSVALFNLVLWIEEQVGCTIDSTALDLIAEWNTVADIVKFIERRRPT